MSPHHPPELAVIAFVLTVAFPALATLCIGLLMWRPSPRLDGICCGIIALTATTPALHSLAASHFLKGTEGAGPTPGPADLLLTVLLSPLFYGFLVLAGLISLPFVRGEARKYQVPATVAVVALGCVQCAVDYQVFVLRSS